MSSARETNLDAFEHFNAFFTRELKPGARPIEGDDNTIISPVDGAVSQAQAIVDGRIFQAKGHSYSVVELLGGDEERAKPFKNGVFATLYLSPRDYHRIHCPIDGKLMEMVHVPGRLFSVSPLTTATVPRLFARNERVAAIFDTAAGPVAVVMVGAIFVSSIDTVWAGTITPPYGTKVRTWKYGEEKPYALDKGDELGRFNMGSTVIVLFGENRVKLDAKITANQPVRMGQHLATRTG
jgi:phosphatidylserine decarboxylase